MSRIIQISDPHIVAPGALTCGVVDTAAALRGLVQQVNSILPAIGPVDLAVVTGDLTDHGRPEEYDHFREIMSDLQLPYRVVPGNHDVREKLRAAFQDRPWINSGSGPVNWRLDLGSCVVIGLDSSVPGVPYGAFTQETLDWLEDHLVQLQDCPLLLMFHHPPVKTGIVPMDAQNLRDSLALKVLLRGYAGTCRIACGHVHRMLTTSFAGHPLVIAPGSSHAVTLDLRADSPNSLTLEPSGMVLHSLAMPSAEDPDPDYVSQMIPASACEGPYPFEG
ncbi:phosphodiesterase [Pseudophaeobacter sp.]|uniref:phosphodiesterase n=1 Tax=Pseudophaeobacter sp. TaxID=1971739 RepID=UPI003299DE08